MLHIKQNKKLKAKVPFLFTIITCVMIFGAGAQNKAYLVLEYMHVKQGNENAYLQAESLWKNIHQHRQKAGSIFSWSVWEVTAPYNMNAAYQYVVATVYPRFSDILDSYDKIDVHQLFPGASDDSLNHIFSAANASRDFLRSDIYEILYETGLNGHMPQYMIITEMKAAPGKQVAYESLEIKDWKPIHQDLIKNGFESAFSFSRLMFPSGANVLHDYSIFRFYNDPGMFDRQDKVNWEKYSTANPAAFSKAKALRTEVRSELLRKVRSLETESK